jgi:hypothetical protein
MRSRTLLLAVLFLSASSLLAQTPKFLWGQGKPMFRSLPARRLNLSAAQGATTTTIPLWHGSFAFQGVTYPFTMVGTAPARNLTSNIPVVVVPIKVVFADKTTLDPTKPVFGSARNAINLVANSPLFKSVPFVPGGTHVGTTQYVDAYQRANFWNKVSTGAPDYHVLLNAPTIVAARTLNVPINQGHTVAGPGSRIGEVDINWFDAQLNSLFAGLLAVNPRVLPIFLTYNVFETDFGSCCILGYHTAFGSPAQTYVVAAYSDADIFNVPIEDIHALSHEIGEWMDDPLINNATPGWSAGQAAGQCQKNLENGDPVTGIAFTVTLNGFTYHPEDLVFLPWFAHRKPSNAVNGWYTFLNTFNAPPAVCQ